MGDIENKLRGFVGYVATLKGDEKGEAQVYCDRLFQAFGWGGYKEAGATLEERVAIQKAVGTKKATRFSDLVWPGKVLIEMKKRGEKLERHYLQAFEYWQYLVPHRPRYVILCNFDEFWIYDFDIQLHEPMDRVGIADLVTRYPALNFLFPAPKKPQFGNDRVAVTKEAADKIATLFNTLVARKVDRIQAQRFVLQCVVALFAEDITLLPKGFFTELILECRDDGASSYDLFGQLFRWMDTPKSAKDGRFKAVQYFNGGLFATVDPVELTIPELALLAEAAKENWSKVQPAIFGTLFQGSMGKEERHALGAHFTSEADIQKIVLPTIVRPWRERIAAAKTRDELLAVRRDLEKFQVLDPACGSGNFLYVAYRELVRVEMELADRLRTEFKTRAKAGARVSSASFVSIKQFHGIDTNEFAVELAKVTMLLGKKLAYDEVVEALNLSQLGMALENPLPLDNLDDHIQKRDALFSDWPMADAIIGNPPYLPKNKMQPELGAAYLADLRARHPAVSGMADYCVYWFRLAHDRLPPGGRAGLVGTNTVRQNQSRESGLDYIVASGGTITEAVSTQVWSGEAAVHVSIVNWLKGKQSGKKVLSWQVGDSVDSPWSKVEIEKINPALSAQTDVTAAIALRANSESEACYQGQTHGHKGFLLSLEDTAAVLSKHPTYGEVLFPFVIGDDLLGRGDGSPSRYAIDFSPRSILEAARYKELFARVKELVLRDREVAAAEEKERNAEVLAANPKARVNHHHRNFLNQWWLFSWPRPELMAKLLKIKRYAACVRTTKRPLFEFISSDVHPNDAIQVFPLEDDYSFGILQSDTHWKWFVERCSTLKRDFRYTSDTVFDSFPWPQSPSQEAVKKVAVAAVNLRKIRQKAMDDNGISRRDLYRSLELPGANPVKDAHADLDAAVRHAYGMKPQADALGFLLELNLLLAAREQKGEAISGPGLPATVKARATFITSDCVKAPVL